MLLLAVVALGGIWSLVTKRPDRDEKLPTRPAVAAPTSAPPTSRSYIPPSKRGDFLAKPGAPAPAAPKTYIPHHRYIFDQAADAYRDLGQEFAKAIAEGRSWVTDDGRVVVITGD
jgi:hypothetical protein